MTGPPLDEGDDGTQSSEPSTRLRGAAVTVDSRRVAQIIGLVCALALAVSGIVLVIAGAHQNAQITALRTRGITIEATVTACIGQVAGSGSNPTGYSCEVAYRAGGHTYAGALPGSQPRSAGDKVAIVADRADPTLISTPPVLATQHASARVFVLPVVLLVCALAIGWLLWRRRRRTVSGVQPARRSVSESGGDDRLGALGGV